MRAFLDKNQVGVIMRVFARKPEQLDSRIEMVSKTVSRFRAIDIDGLPAVGRFDILVWADQERFSQQSDFGGTAEALRLAFSGDRSVLVTEFTQGDLFCALLNFGVAQQLRQGIDYSVIISPDAYSYVTIETVAAMLEAAGNGALAISVALNELTELVLHGIVQNTFAMWHASSLLSVGGFDLRAATKLDDDRLVRYMRGWRPEEGIVYYPLHGVEEVIPLARLIQNYGQCMAPVLPSGEGVQLYQVPDPARDPELYRRHVAKLGTKGERIAAMLAHVGVEPSFLEGGIMEQYRAKVLT